MTFKSEITQIYGLQGSSAKFNLHVESTALGWGLFARPTTPASQSIVLAETPNITLKNTAYNTASVSTGGAITAVSTDGEITLNVETLVGGTFANDTILVYAYDNAGSFGIGVAKVSLSEFTAGDPNTYPGDFPICEIVTTSGMTTITSIVDVRGTGSIKSAQKAVATELIVSEVNWDTSVTTESSRGFCSWSDANYIYWCGICNTSQSSFATGNFMYIQKTDHDGVVISSYVYKHASPLTYVLSEPISIIGDTTHLYITCYADTVIKVSQSDLTSYTVKTYASNSTGYVRLYWNNAVVVGNYLYCAGYEDATTDTAIIAKFNKSDLSFVSAKTFRGTATTQPYKALSLDTDGTYLYFLVNYNSSTNQAIIKLDSTLSIVASQGNPSDSSIYRGIRYHDGKVYVYTTAGTSGNTRAIIRLTTALVYEDHFYELDVDAINTVSQGSNIRRTTFVAKGGKTWALGECNNGKENLVLMQMKDYFDTAKNLFDKRLPTVIEHTEINGGTDDSPTLTFTGATNRDSARMSIHAIVKNNPVTDGYFVADSGTSYSTDMVWENLAIERVAKTGNLTFTASGITTTTTPTLTPTDNTANLDKASFTPTIYKYLINV